MGRWLSGRWMVTPPIPSDEEFAWARNSIPLQNSFFASELLQLLWWVQFLASDQNSKWREIRPEGTHDSSPAIHRRVRCI